MKEVYYNQESIAVESERFLALVFRLRNHHKMILQPPRVALLVLDMQRYFLDSESHAFVPSAPAIVPNIKNLQDHFLSKGQPVFQTCHTNTPENAHNMKEWWRQLIDPDSKSATIIPELSQPKVYHIEKNQYDAFMGTSLEDQLIAAGVTQLVITGVMTHLCCETTARSAFMRGFEVFFTVDGTATYNREFHQATLLNLSHGFAVPVTSLEIVAQIGMAEK
jgi:isochorismate hydrolase